MRPLSLAERQLRQKQGARLAIALEFAGLTQRELAEQLQSQRPEGSSRLTQGFLAQIITGLRHASPELLRQASKATKVPLSYLTDGEGWEPPPSVIRVGQPPKKSLPVSLDAECISMVRVHGRAGYRLSGSAVKALADAINKDIDPSKQISHVDDVLVITLGSPKRIRAKPRRNISK